jgi:hypothetical protein
MVDAAVISVTFVAEIRLWREVDEASCIIRFPIAPVPFVSFDFVFITGVDKIGSTTWRAADAARVYFSSRPRSSTRRAQQQHDAADTVAAAAIITVHAVALI